MRNAKSIHAPIENRKLFDRFSLTLGRLSIQPNPTILNFSRKNATCGAWKLIWQRVHGMWRQPDQQQYTVIHAQALAKSFFRSRRTGFLDWG
jgi:hypothetical protein